MQYLVQSLPRLPRICVWEITDKCQLRCIHCEGSAGPKKTNELSTAEALDLCHQLKELQCEKVHLSGGEPLLRSDWDQIAGCLKSLGIAVHLVTNGLTFNEAVAKRCQELKIDLIAVSLDGVMETHDGIRRYPGGNRGKSPFRKAYEALCLAKLCGFPTAAVTHVNGRNIKELPALHQLLSLAQIDGWQIQLGVPLGRMTLTEPGYLIPPDRISEVIEFIVSHRNGGVRISVADNVGYFSKHEPVLRPMDGKHLPCFAGCYAGIRSVAIESNGNVKGCPSMPSHLSEGNLRHQSLKQIWENPEAFEYNRKWSSQKLSGFCARCEFRHICRAGCTTQALATGGTWYENRYCQYYQSQCLGEQHIGEHHGK